MQPARAWMIALALSLAALSAPRAQEARLVPAAGPVRAAHGIVAASSGIAARVGTEILRRGGNAVDAAIAVGLAEAVTYPTAGNLGGGGFMVIRLAGGRTTTLDFREMAPAKAHRDLYLDSDGRVGPHSSTIGHLASGIPGTVAGFELARRKHGTLKWADLVEPARRLAEEGFPVSAALANGLQRTPQLARFPETRRVFQRDGAYYRAGEIFRQPDLAATLKRIQEKGAKEFYEGETARLLAAEMERGGGLITVDDLKRYRPVERRPLQGRYRGYEIVTMPPPSSGGIALLQMLQILEHADLSSLRADSPQRYHLIIEAMRRAFADRAEFLGDPDFVRVPVKGLLARDYTSVLFSSIDPVGATPSRMVGHGNPAFYESPETTHYSVVDAQGNAVAVTYTLNSGYGSGVTVTGAGFLLNNEMDDFAALPGVPNQFGLVQGEANAVGPRKRPLSSMTPTIVSKDGKLWLVTGSPGGPTIINTVLQVVLNAVDHGMNVKQAVDRARVHHQWLPDEVRHEPGLEPLVETLKARGHVFAARASRIGDAQSIMIEPGTGARLGASDRRSADGEAIGY